MSLELSFSASGWLFIYQLGVAKALQDAGIHRKRYCKRCVGSSGGSLVSAALITDTDIEYLKDYMLDCVAECRSNRLKNGFKMRDYVKGAFIMVKNRLKREQGASETFQSVDGEFFDHPDIVDGRLGVSVTVLPSCQNYILTKFDSQNELEEAILGSCTMSPLAGLPFKLNRPNDGLLHQRWVFDGGLSNIQPLTGVAERVVTVSPFYHWDSDIKPSKYVPLWWGISPPTVEEMDDLFKLGVSDANTWLKENVEYLKDSAHQNEMGESLTDIEPVFEEEVLDDNNFSSNGDAIVVGAETYTVKRYRTTEFERVIGEVRGKNPRRTQLKRSTSMPNLKPVGWWNKTLDSALLFSQKNIVRSVAVGSIYAELGVLFGWNVAKSGFQAVERTRRNWLSPSSHFFSIRRWLPQSVIGSPDTSFTEALDNAKALLNPVKVWREVSERLDFSGKPANKSKVDGGERSQPRPSTARVRRYSMGASHRESIAMRPVDPKVVEEKERRLLEKSFVLNKLIKTSAPEN